MTRPHPFSQVSPALIYIHPLSGCDPIDYCICGRFPVRVQCDRIRNRKFEKEKRIEGLYRQYPTRAPSGVQPGERDAGVTNSPRPSKVSSNPIVCLWRAELPTGRPNRRPGRYGAHLDHMWCRAGRRWYRSGSGGSLMKSRARDRFSSIAKRQDFKHNEYRPGPP
jgi:hypothetical protein